MSTSDTSPSEVPDGTTTQQPTTGTESSVTYYGDVQPILATSCGRCHGPDGVGPGDFTNPDIATAWAEVMLDRVDAGEMPPPMADPECHPYQGSDHVGIDDGARDVLAAWIDAEKPLGDPASASAEIPEVPSLSRRDVELFAAAEYVPDFEDGNEYRCFLFDDVIDADVYLSGLEFVLDNPEISHHALLFVDADGGSEALVTDPSTRSWQCSGVQPQPEFALIHAWAPGGGALEFPEGKGLKVTAGSQIVVQMHYFAGTAEIPADRPGYALKLEDVVEEELFYVALGPTDFVIPAGDPSFSARLDIPMWLLGFGVLEYDVYGVLPHMHVLGDGYDFYATDPEGGQTCISRADAYDFAMQPTYWFDSPVAVESDDTLTISCTWDNSADNPAQVVDPPGNVTWGENTQQEMCYALMYVGARLAF